MKERHWLTVLRIWIQTPGAGWLTRMTSPSLSVPPSLSGFQVNITLGLGSGFCFHFLRLRWRGRGYTEQEWIFRAKFMEFSKFEESGNFGFKHWQEFPLEISVAKWLSSIAASPPAFHSDRWQSKFNTLGNVFHLRIFPLAPTTQYVWPSCSQRLSREATDQGLKKTSPKPKFCQKISTSRTSPETI